MRIVSWVAAACLGGLLGLVAACDSAPGPEQLGLRPPLLQDFTFSPQRVVFGVLPPEQIVGDSVRVPLELSVVAFGSQSPIEEVSYVVQSPFSSFEPIRIDTNLLEDEIRISNSDLEIRIFLRFVQTCNERCMQ